MTHEEKQFNKKALSTFINHSTKSAQRLSGVTQTALQTIKVVENSQQNKKIPSKPKQDHFKGYQTSTAAFYTQNMEAISIDLTKPHDQILPKMVPHGRFEKVTANTLAKNSPTKYD